MITGEFTSHRGNLYKVEFGCDFNFTIQPHSDIVFTEDPIEIEQDVDDTFEHIIKTTCTINMMSRIYLGDYLFASNGREITAKVYKNDEIIFSGYVQPLSFSQDFAEEYSEVEIECYDYLSTLEDFKYNQSGNPTQDYEDAKANCETKSFNDMLINILSPSGCKILYDASVAPYNNQLSKDFSSYGISESLLYGDEEDDLWTEEEVVEEIMRYLNLHIKMDGDKYLIFHWSKLRNYDGTEGNNTLYYDIQTGEEVLLPLKNVTVDKDYYSSDDTNVSLGDIYNKITIECDLEDTEDVFKSPLDSEDLVSPFTYKFRFLTEQNESDTTHDWYTQNLINPNWTFRWWDKDNKVARDWNDKFNELATYTNKSTGEVGYYYQFKLMDFVQSRDCCPYLCNFGKVDAQTATDDTKKNNLDMSPYIVISINGSRNKDNDRTALFNEISEAYEKAGGMIEYKSSASAGLLSPTDSVTTNYIVFSGKIGIQPHQPSESPWFNDQGYDGWHTTWYGDWENKTIQPRAVTNPMKPWLGYDDKWQNQFAEYYGDWLYNNSESGTDEISKVPLLICELKVGDKYAVETEIDTFKWYTKEECDALGIANTFTLGFNPALGDYFLCEEWDISNTLDISSGVDAEGTAIPIKMTDKLSGKVEFRVIGVWYYNQSQAIRRHPTAFRHTKWWTTNIPIMEFVDDIYISDFECKVYSDNGKIDYASEDDKDLVYTSDVMSNSTQEKDDITFKFNTALTTAECTEKGIKNGIKLSNVIDMNNGIGISTLLNHCTTNTGKAEELYISDYYDEYSKPKIIIESTMNANKMKNVNKCTFSYFPNKEFLKLGYTFNAIEDNIELKLKEI